MEKKSEGNKSGKKLWSKVKMVVMAASTAVAIGLALPATVDAAMVHSAKPVKNQKAVAQANITPASTPNNMLAQTTNGNFVLYVSNQSFDASPVDITVSIDGNKAISADFAHGNGHNWVRYTYQLAPGKHKIAIVSTKGGSQLEKEFEISAKHWAVINYWYTKRNGKKKFSFDIKKTIVRLM